MTEVILPKICLRLWTWTRESWRGVVYRTQRESEVKGREKQGEEKWREVTRKRTKGESLG